MRTLIALLLVALPAAAQTPVAGARYASRGELLGELVDLAAANQGPMIRWVVNPADGRQDLYRAWPDGRLEVVKSVAAGSPVTAEAPPPPPVIPPTVTYVAPPPAYAPPPPTVTYYQPLVPPISAGFNLTGPRGGSISAGVCVGPT